jgi:hypothetical protein
MILGIEALVALNLRLGEFTISLLNRRIPICDTTKYTKLEIIDAVKPTDEEVIIANLRIVDECSWIQSEKFEIVNPIFPEDEKFASRFL